MGTFASQSYTPDAVDDVWNAGSVNVRSAFIYRETYHGASARIADLYVGDEKKDALLMDYAVDDGGGNEVQAHSFQWTNILYRDGHARGFSNEKTVGTDFTTDGDDTSSSTISAWTNADSVE